MPRAAFGHQPHLPALHLAPLAAQARTAGSALWDAVAAARALIGLVGATLLLWSVAYELNVIGAIGGGLLIAAAATIELAVRQAAAEAKDARTDDA